MRVATVGELIDLLGEFDENAPLAIAVQPTWPLETTVAVVALVGDGKVYLAQGESIGYLNADACHAVGWSPGG